MVRSHSGSGFLTEKTDRRSCCVVSSSALVVTVLCKPLCSIFPMEKLLIPAINVYVKKGNAL